MSFNINQAFVDKITQGIKDDLRPQIVRLRSMLYAAHKEGGDQGVKRLLSKMVHGQAPAAREHHFKRALDAVEKAMSADEERGALLLKPGTRVRRGERDDPGAELGVVVSSWLTEHGDADCYVAFFGTVRQHDGKFPEGEPRIKPYVLHYFSSTLTVVGPMEDT